MKKGKTGQWGKTKMEELMRNKYEEKIYPRDSIIV
jgi:hypothetical protein